MVTYDFYTDTYLGTAVPGKVFPRYAAQAQSVLDRLCSVCRVVGGDESRAMAVCAMAETLYRHDRYGGVESASAGEVSVRYSQSRSLSAALYAQAGIYLDIYRGVRQ